MSWNNNLYAYAQDRGGTYFHGAASGWSTVCGWDATLLLEHQGRPMPVSCVVASSGRYGVSYAAQVQLSCELERDYNLEIGPKGAVRQGLNTVLSQLDRGAERLGQDVDLHRDYGFPEVTGGRRIKTDDPEFTGMVLRDLDLRTCLLEHPKYALRVCKNAPSFFSTGVHVVTAWTGLGGVNDDWDLGGEPDVLLMSREEQQKWVDARIRTSFAPRLDALIELAKAAQRAVTTWRMPIKRD